MAKKPETEVKHTQTPATGRKGDGAQNVDQDPQIQAVPKKG